MALRVVAITLTLIPKVCTQDLQQRQENSQPVTTDAVQNTAGEVKLLITEPLTKQTNHSESLSVVMKEDEGTESKHF